jgi:hypothetical protein
MLLIECFEPLLKNKSELRAALDDNLRFLFLSPVKFRPEHPAHLPIIIIMAGQTNGTQPSRKALPAPGPGTRALHADDVSVAKKKRREGAFTCPR